MLVVSIVIFVFLLHARSALIPILTIPIGIALAFVPMLYQGLEREHHVARRHRRGDRRDGRRGDHRGRERPQTLEAWEQRAVPATRRRDPARDAGGGTEHLLRLLVITVSFLPIFALEGPRAPVQAARVHEDLRDGLRGACSR
jgi:Cu(I)/Ag(I) efflux system membrane protein CusA/SilA